MSFKTGDWLLDEIMVAFEGRELPLDPRRLIEAVYDATSSVAWPPWQQRDDSAPAPVLRSVLTYSYVAGILSSEDIEAAATHDAVVRYLCANHPLSWESIRAFRRANQSSLFHALSSVIEKLLRVSPARARFLASERLNGAIRADSAAMDT